MLAVVVTHEVCSLSLSHTMACCGAIVVIRTILYFIPVNTLFVNMLHVMHEEYTWAKIRTMLYFIHADLDIRDPISASPLNAELKS